MARLEAVADALYYPSPEPVITPIARLLRLEPLTPRVGGFMRLLDPCIGKGRAVALLADQLCAQADYPAAVTQPGDPAPESLPYFVPGSAAGQRGPIRLDLYGVEVNRTRAQEAARHCRGGLLVTSFFNTTIAEASFQIAFVNPPYDDDSSNSTGRRVRLEVQFLKRATHKLAPEGILIWIVPQARVGEAAAYLASYYDQLTCWRFPDDPWKAPDAPPSGQPLPMYGTYQQVVLLGKRRLGAVPPNPTQVAELEHWSALGPLLPILPGASATASAADPEELPSYRVPLARGQIPTFEAWAYDCDATARLVSLPGVGVWHQPTYREQRWPELDTSDLGIGRPPMPLREGHLSLLVASGAANGLEVEGKRGRRALVKGGSAKERVRSVEVDDEGTRRDIETERFVNEVYLLDLEGGDLLHVIGGPLPAGAPGDASPAGPEAAAAASPTSPTTSGAPSGKSSRAPAAAAPTPLVFTPHTLTMAEFLGEFGPSLMAQVAEAAPPIYLGPEDAPFAPLSVLTRQPLGAQGLIAQAKACAIRGQRPSAGDPGWPRVRRLGNVGEMGTGKTFLAVATLALADEDVTGVVAPAGKRPYKRGFFPALVICPPIMVEKWVREAGLTLGARVKATVIRALETREDVAAFRHFDPSFTGKQLSALGVAQRVVRRTQQDLAMWRRVRAAALADGRTPPRKPCHLVVLSHSTAKLGSAWSPRYVLRALRTPDLNGRSHLVRQASGAPYVVPSCPRCFAPLTIDEAEASGAKQGKGRGGSKDQDGETDAVYLTEAQLQGEAGRRIKRTCQACGESQWQMVPEVTTARATWRATPPPLAGADDTGHLVLVRRTVAGLPIPNRHRSIKGLTGPLNRRYPIADYLRRHHKGLFRTLIADEAHEFSGGETAQALALASLQEVCEPGGTTIWLTGTLFSGYASELFQMQRILNEDVLQQFGWHGHRRWMERYGVERHIVITPPDDRGVGAVSKRKEGREVTQEMPGISPLMLRHILRCCVFVELADVARDLPPLTEEVRAVPLGPVLEPVYHRFEREATAELHAQLATGDRGALSSWYHGLLIQPNLPSRAIEVRHASTGEVLARTDAFPEATIWPKEAELLRVVREERRERRRVLVFVEHTGAYDLLARLARLIQEDDRRWRAGLPPCDSHADDRDSVPPEFRAVPAAMPGSNEVAFAVSAAVVQACVAVTDMEPGTSKAETMMPQPALGPVRVALLRSNTCPTARREAWLARTVQQGCDVLLVHSACVQVGLDLLDFPTIVCLETIPSTNRARQATRRSYRPGQRLPVRVIQLTYDGTAEARLLLLVARKMRNSLMAEGKLPGEGLATYGEDDGDLMLQLARAVLEDVRSGAGRGMAGSLEAIFQEVRQLDQQASRFIGGEQLEAALAAGDMAVPLGSIVEAVPTLTSDEPALEAPGLFDGTLTADPSSAVEAPRGGEGVVRVTSTTTSTTLGVGRSWEELGQELASMRRRRRSGGKSLRDATPTSTQQSEPPANSLWSQQAEAVNLSLWTTDVADDATTVPTRHDAMPLECPEKPGVPVEVRATLWE